MVTGAVVKVPQILVKESVTLYVPWLLNRIIGFIEVAFVPEIKTKSAAESAIHVKLVFVTVHSLVIGPQVGKPVEVFVKLTTNGVQPINGVAVNDGVGGPCTQMVLVIVSLPQLLLLS